jgi:protein SCO1/2
MLGLLIALWGDSLRESFRWVWRRPMWRFAGFSLTIATIGFFTTLGLRVARAQATAPAELAPTSGILRRIDREAPADPLLDQNGAATSLSKFQGERVLLTFAYGHCSTVCPSTVNDLRTARRESKADDTRIVILTMDPWRDTPERLATLTSHWKLDPGDKILSGEVRDVESVLDQLSIGRKRNETTGDIDHGATVMLLDERGKIAWRVDGGVMRDFANLLRASRNSAD